MQHCVITHTWTLQLSFHLANTTTALKAASEEVKIEDKYVSFSFRQGKLSHPLRQTLRFYLAKKVRPLSPKSLESPILNVNYQSGIIHRLGYREELYNNK